MSGGDRDRRTEKATPRKLRQAREQGKVANSRTLTSTLQFVVLVLAIPPLAKSAADRVVELLPAYFTLTTTSGFDSSSPDAIGEIAGPLIEFVAVVLVLAMVSGMLFSGLQVGVLFAPAAMKPRLESLNPITGLQQRIFSTRSLVELLKAVVIIGVLGVAIWSVLSDSLGELASLPRATPWDIASRMASMGIRMLRPVMLVMGIVALADLAYQRHRFHADQRMTKEEVRREHKDNEGDPQMRARRRQFAQELQMRTMLERTRKAHVLVTNPDHIACALIYEPNDGWEAPTLTASGRNAFAEEMKRIAAEEGIPIIRNVPLAHTLFQMEMDEEIPDDLFEAIQEIFRWVADLHRAEGRVPPWEVPDEA